MARSAVAATYAGENGAIGKVRGFWERTAGFLKEVRTEMKHVSYPSMKEVKGTTIVVIITVAIFGIFFFLTDFVFSHAMDWVFHRFGQ